MHQFEFTAKIAGDDLKRLRQKKGISGLALGIVAVLAIAWVSSGISVSPVSANFGNMQVGQGSKLQKVVLTNRNMTDFEPVRIVVQGSSGSDFQLNSKSCAKVEAGQSCDLLVEFRPRHPGIVMARLVVYGSDGQELTTDFRGIATDTSEPRVMISPSPIDFGAMDLHQALRKTVTLTNPNPTPLDAIQVGLTENTDGRFGLLDTAVCRRLPAQGSCRLQIDFTAKAVGVSEAALSVHLSNGSDVKAALTGTALAPTTDSAPLPRIRIDPEVLDFSQPNPAQQTFMVFNNGTAASKIGFNLAGENAERFNYDAGACGTTIAPSDSGCKVVVTFRDPSFPLGFAAKGKPQPVTAQLQISDDDPNKTGSSAVQLRWQAPSRGVPRISVEPEALDFSPPKPSRQTLTILNSGTAASSIGFNLKGANSDRFSYDATACGNTIAPAGGLCNVVVTYKRKIFGKPVDLSVQLEVSHDDPEVTTPLPVMLTWAPNVPPVPIITMAPDSIDFGTLRSGTAAQSRMVVIRNEGPGALTNWTLRLGQFGGGENKQFTHGPACAATLQEKQECSVQVGFTSAQPGRFSTELYVMGGAMQLQSFAHVDLEGQVLQQQVIGDVTKNRPGVNIQ